LPLHSCGDDNATLDTTTGTPTDSVDYWAAKAAEYDTLYDAQSASGDWLRARQAVVLRLVGSGPGRALDVGMGSGRLVEALEHQGWTAWGVDGAAEMVALAQARVPAAADRLLEGRIEQLPFEPESFDTVVSTGMFAYATDRPTMLAEIARVLRPGGRVVMSTSNARSPTHFWRHEIVYPVMRAAKRRVAFGVPPPFKRDRVPGRRRIEQMFAETGLQVETVEFTSCGIVPDPLDRVFPRTARTLAGRANGLRPSVRHLVAGQIVVAARRAA
jgi:ubiquinone/menaquinone biosynthesis C-methylase UbiE